MDDGAQEKSFEGNKRDFDTSRLINQKVVPGTQPITGDKTYVPVVSDIARSKLWQSLPCSTKTRQWKYVNGTVAISSLGSFLWGYNISVVAGAMLLIDDHFNLSVLWHEAIVSVLFGGATVGAAIAGILNDKFGRWKVMMMSAILHVLAAVVMALAFSEIFLVIGRTIAGLALGLFSVTGPVYVSEMAPSHVRGKLGLVNYLTTGGGVLSGSIAAGLFTIDTQHAYTFGWRYMLGLSVIPSLLMCCGLWFLFETPRWLVFHGKSEKARKVMEKIRSDSAVDKELQNIQKDYELHIRNALGTFQFIKRVCHTKTLLHALFIGCSIQMFSAFCGIAVIITYSSTLFKMVGFSLKEAIWFAILPSFLNLASKTASCFIVERIGRRKLYILSGTFAILFITILATFLFLGNSASPAAVPLTKGGKCDYRNCGTCVANSHCGFCTVNVNGEYLYGTCSEGNEDGDDLSDGNTKCAILNKMDNSFNLTSNASEWYFDHCSDNNKYAILSLVTVMLLTVSTSAGIVSVPWVINSEIYPTWARGQATSLSSLVNWIINLILLLTFLSTVDALGLPQVIIIYAVLSFIGVVFIFLFLPETSNQPLEKIETLFDRPYFLTWYDSNICGKKKGIVKYSTVEQQQPETFEMA